MILRTSPRTTLRSIDIHTVSRPIVNEMVCTFVRSSHANFTLPSILSKCDSSSFLMAMFENW